MKVGVAHLHRSPCVCSKLEVGVSISLHLLDTPRGTVDLQLVAWTELGLDAQLKSKTIKLDAWKQSGERQRDKEWEIERKTKIKNARKRRRSKKLMHEERRGKDYTSKVKSGCMVRCVCTYSCAEMVSLFHCVGSQDDATTLLHSLYHLSHLPIETQEEISGREREQESNEFYPQLNLTQHCFPDYQWNNHTHLSPNNQIESGCMLFKNEDVWIANACHDSWPRIPPERFVVSCLLRVSYRFIAPTCVWKKTSFVRISN